MVKAFGRFRRRERISESMLCDAIARAEKGLVDANLGGRLIKQRVARRGVLVKDAPPGNELVRLGLRPLPSRRSPRIVFGWAAAQ